MRYQKFTAWETRALRELGCKIWDNEGYKAVLNAGDVLIVIKHPVGTRDFEVHIHLGNRPSLLCRTSRRELLNVIEEAESQRLVQEEGGMKPLTREEIADAVARLREREHD